MRTEPLSFDEFLSSDELGAKELKLMLGMSISNRAIASLAYKAGLAQSTIAHIDSMLAASAPKVLS